MVHHFYSLQETCFSGDNYLFENLTTVVGEAVGITLGDKHKLKYILTTYKLRIKPKIKQLIYIKLSSQV